MTYIPMNRPMLTHRPMLHHRPHHNHLAQMLMGQPSHRHSIMQNGMNYYMPANGGSPLPMLLGVLGASALIAINSLIQERPITFRGPEDAKQQWHDGVVKARDALDAVLSDGESAYRRVIEAAAQMKQAEQYLGISTP